jgi:pheromone shutdown protein TraB
MTRTTLIAIGMTAASIWVGSLVCLAVVSVAAREALDGQSRVALFRRVGRLYGLVGTGSLLTATAVGLALAWPLSDVDGAIAPLFALAALLVAATIAGMAQARRMTVHRQRLLAVPGDQRAIERVRRGARVAGALRGSLALITLAIVVIGAHLLNR